MIICKVRRTAMGVPLFLRVGRSDGFAGRLAGLKQKGVPSVSRLNSPGIHGTPTWLWVPVPRFRFIGIEEPRDFLYSFAL